MRTKMLLSAIAPLLFLALPAQNSEPVTDTNNAIVAAEKTTANENADSSSSRTSADATNTPAFDAVVYPNPGNGQLNVDLGGVYDMVEVEIVNASGQRVQDRMYEKTRFLQTKIDGSDGMYFITIRTNDKQFSTLKVIKE